MGDTPHHVSGADPLHGVHTAQEDQGQVDSTHLDPRYGNPPLAFHTQFSGPSRQGHGTEMSQPTAQSSDPQEPAHSHDPQGTALNMGTMSGSLPEYVAMPGTHGIQPVQRGISASSPMGGPPPPVVYQFQQIAQFSGSGQGPYQGHGGVPSGYPTAQYPQPYAVQQAGPTRGYGAFPQGPPRPTHPQQRTAQFQHPPSGYYYYPYGSPTSAGPYPQMPPQGYPPYNQRSSNQGNSRRGGFPGQDSALSPRPGGNLDAMNYSSSPRILGSMPRGPPRKPKQSGHALWVGNLPPNASIADLKDHFSREATGDIESVFLISKSNCAFVNYRTEASCVAAMRRFHDSRFHTIRLVCRLRKSSVASPITPSTPASSVSPGPSSSQPETDAANETAPDQGEEQADEGVDEVNEAPQSEEAESPSPGNTSRKSIESGADRYFIVKSLTLQDLESSVVTGIWSTQVHNEKTFNKAFETAPNVWLIFSSNKSGEYFGYARMASSVGADSEELLSKLSRNEEEVPESDAPLSYITTSTETAPRGRVVDDSARGTIFWQREDEDADFTADDDLPTESRSDPPASSPIASSSSSTLQEWGRPFRVEWKTTTRVPFYRARGLRNPWNSNREVKIARDGTELETSVGKRLVDLFHARIPSGAPPMPPTRGVSDPTMRMG